jgi:hypothetical protein
MTPVHPVWSLAPRKFVPVLGSLEIAKDDEFLMLTNRPPLQPVA